VISQVGERLKTALGLQKRLKMDKRDETISAARAFLKAKGYKDGDFFIDAWTEVLSEFHLSQSRDAWTPVKDRQPARTAQFEVTDSNGFVSSAMYSVKYGVWQGVDVIAWKEHTAPYDQEK
jgi:hypothetical protein